LNFGKLDEMWQARALEAITGANHWLVLYYTPRRTGTSTSYDRFFREGVDGKDPDTFSGVTNATTSPALVRGRIHLDLHGTSVSGDEEIRRLNIGAFKPGDALFECILSDVATTNGTVFDDVQYAVLHTDGEPEEADYKTGDRYSVENVLKRGLEDPYMCDVFLEKTNVE